MDAGDGRKPVSPRRSGAPAGMQRARWILMGIATLLILVVLGFIAVARYRTKNYLTGLPKRLGVDIQQQSDSFTYSQSSKGKTLFTVHASKEIQRRNGKIGLHDVGIVLYGPTGQPTDRIHGADFEYDQKLQRMTAQGEVYIDLVPPASANLQPVKPGDAEARMVHVKTIGLDFDQKAETASTSGAVEFRTAGYAGGAVGASYDAKRNVVILLSSVRLSGLRKDRPVLLTAERAELDRQSNVVDLVSAHYLSTGNSGTQSAEAHHAIVLIQQDGTPERVDAEGGVRLEGAQQGEIASKRMALLLGPRGQAKDAHFIDEVRYRNDEGPKHSKGHATDVRIAFDSAGRAQRAAMSGGVGFVELDAASERELDAATVNVALSGGGDQPAVVRGAEAFGPGGAHLRMVDEDAKGRRTTDVHANKLVGRFAAAAKKTVLTGLDGTGNSQVERATLDPRRVMLSKDTSHGESLKIDFKLGADSRPQLSRAEQHGNVRTLRETLGKNGEQQVEHGRSDDMVFETQTNLVHMTGSVEVQDASSAILADRLDINRATGDATANGAVRASYLQQPAAGVRASEQQEPVHVIAMRAVFYKGIELTEFFGDAHRRARLWQGSSQVEAPVLDFYLKEKRLIARGASADDAAAVRAVLVGTSINTGAKPSSGPLRVSSRQMIYADATRTIEFTGEVRAVDQGGMLTAQQATVWLAGAGVGTGVGAGVGTGVGAGTSKETSGLMGGKIDHMVATGSVVLEQPGRRGTGEKLVYTAVDSTYVLTGTRSVPPRVEDSAEGSTTGAALRFRSGDDSVQVLGSEDGKVAGRVRSETRVKH